jgi:hypothetical protein
MNRVDVALSQRPRIFLVMPLQSNLCENILTLQCDNDWCKEVKGFIRHNKMMVPIFEEFTLDDDGLLRFKNQIYVPPNDGLRSLILNEAHRAVCMAHLGVTKMRADLKPLFFWKGMKADIVNYVAICLECQQVKAEHRHPSRITTATRYSIIEMGGHFDGFHCWIATDGKETRLNFCGSRHSNKECSFYSCAYDV